MSDEEIIKSVALNYNIFPLDKIQEEVEKIISQWSPESGIYYDRDLMKDIQKYRQGSYGSPDLDSGEVGRIMKAFRSPQYNRFILHLLHSYTDPRIIHPMDGEETCRCSICGNTLFQYKKWVCNEASLALISEETTLPLCRNCLVQLNYAKEFLYRLGKLDWQINNY